MFRRRYGLDRSAGSVAAGDKAKDRLLQYSQQTQFVAGKNFFQNGNQWIDSAVQKHQGSKKVRIQFGSPEYFNLVSQEPKALPWLALGQNVQFVLNNVIYDITNNFMKQHVTSSLALATILLLAELRLARHKPTPGRSKRALRCVLCWIQRLDVGPDRRRQAEDLVHRE